MHFKNFYQDTNQIQDNVYDLELLYAFFSSNDTSMTWINKKVLETLCVSIRFLLKGHI